MKTKRFIRFIVWLALPVCLADAMAVYAQSNNRHTDTRPNIILIYIDDLGYSDLGCYGNEYGADFIETPHIDRFASQSIKFTHAYTAAPICSPARAALLTGKSPARLQFEFVTKWERDRYQWDDTAWTNKFRKRPLVPPPYTLNLPLSETTVAEVLQSAGYHTAMVGKWHVSSHHQVYNGWNPDFGPDKQGFEWTANTVGAFGKGSLADRKNALKGEFPPDTLTNEAIRYLNQQHDAPFFLYVSHYYVHTPLDNHMKWILNKYREKAKQKGLAISNRRIQYAAFVETMDHYVGQLLQAVDDAGLSENTMVILTSDNGGMPEFAHNRPFRGSKWNLYEGGIRIPMLIHYPKSTLNGTVSSGIVSQMDFLPTFYEIASGKPYSERQLDGQSFLPLLEGKETAGLKTRALYWHFPYYHPEGELFEDAKSPIGQEDEYVSRTYPQSAIQKDGYKLLYFYEDGRTELYNLLTDPREEKELGQSNPALTASLKKELLRYLGKVNARLPKAHEDL